jgi:hypothetical protein
VRVRVDEAGHDHAAGGVEARFARVSGAQFIGRFRCDDLLVTDEDCAVFDDTKRAERASALGTAGEGQELGCGMDEHTLIKP